MTEIKVYTSIGCGTCAQVKEYLKKADIEFKECDITEYEYLKKADIEFKECDITEYEYAEELKTLGAMSVPCVVAGDMVIRGFDKAKLDALIACLTAAECA